MTGRTPARVAADRWVLLADGSLRAETGFGMAPLLDRWLPRVPYSDRIAAPGGAVIRLRAGRPPAHAPTSAPTLLLGGVSAWVSGDRATLRGGAGGAGRLRLDGGEGVLTVPADGAADARAWDAYSMATLSVALLLGRRGQALVHAAAPVAPDGRAWLLVGDTHAGKTTTCANLITAGWRFASDDHVVVGRGADGTLWVEGLPRPFHIDAGWGASTPVGRREATDPQRAWPGRWIERAPLGGVLLPQVSPGSPTLLTATRPAEALAALIRQSPWLVADRAAAPAILALLGETARHRPHRLRLGLDTFADPHRLAALFADPG